MKTITPEKLAMPKSRTCIELLIQSVCLSEFCHNTHDLFKFFWRAFSVWGWLATTALKSALSHVRFRLTQTDAFAAPSRISSVLCF